MNHKGVNSLTLNARRVVRLPQGSDEAAGASPPSRNGHAGVALTSRERRLRDLARPRGGTRQEAFVAPVVGQSSPLPGDLEPLHPTDARERPHRRVWAAREIIRAGGSVAVGRLRAQPRLARGINASDGPGTHRARKRVATAGEGPDDPIHPRDPRSACGSARLRLPGHGALTSPQATSRARLPPNAGPRGSGRETRTGRSSGLRR